MAPTMDGVPCDRGLTPEGYLIPWSQWNAGPFRVRTEVCQVRRDSPQGPLCVVGARARVLNTSPAERRAWLYVALRPMGPAGWPVKDLAVGREGSALMVEGHPAIVAHARPTSAGVVDDDAIGRFAREGRLPEGKTAKSDRGACSGAFRYETTIPAGKEVSMAFACPVLPGRRAVGHRWDGVNPWFQLDLARPNPMEGGRLQPDPGPEYYAALLPEVLFDEAAAYWKKQVGPARVCVPDPRWGQGLAAIAGHIAMGMNEGAPDLVVVNINVFTRDGAYMANFFQKVGRTDLAAASIDYYLAHPFSGRVQPEADNPGQILWLLGQHWLFTRDKAWLARVYPSVGRLAALVRYCRTTPGPHWIDPDGLAFGAAVDPDRRKQLKPGACDGHHPEYTEAFDVAGLRAAAALAAASGRGEDAAAWQALAESLFAKYDRQFGKDLGRSYGSYAVLWPCRLYPLDRGAAHERFKATGPQRPVSWRYFPLATAHQGLLAGRRAAGHGTVRLHLDHEQMQGWYAFDEGGATGAGGWPHLKGYTTWDPSVAMPDAWAVAEVGLLIRDCLLFEDGDRLVLLAGVPEEWFTRKEGMSAEDLPTWFGRCSFRYARTADGASLDLGGAAAPPGGFVLRLPEGLAAGSTADGKPLPPSPGSDLVLPRETKRVEVRFGPGRRASAAPY